MEKRITRSAVRKENGDCHMPEVQPSKRQRLEQPRPQAGESSHALSKKQKLNNQARGSQGAPAEARDNSPPTIPLTEGALKGLHHENAQLDPHRQRYTQQPHLPVTRHAAAKWKESMDSWVPTVPAPYLLYFSSAEDLRKVRLFARRGGPDLSDLKGVRTAACLLTWC